MTRQERLARLRRALVVAAGGSVCVFVGTWALVQLGAPVSAGYALVFAFTAAGVWAVMRPLSDHEHDADAAGERPTRPRPDGR